MQILQELMFPNLVTPAGEEMYLRLDGRSWVDLRGRTVQFSAGAVVSTDTFFNGFTAGTWKRECDVRTLALEIEGEGEFVVTVGLHRLGQSSVWLAEQRIALAQGGRQRVTLPCWREIPDGMLFYRLRALGAGVLSGSAFVTDDEPPNLVRLGIVITHYNRQLQAQAAVRRIRHELLDAPAMRHCVTLTVVDNSSNLAIEPHPRIRLLPNRNLGGTGGFVRGLLELIDRDTCTHALFMDDDASCETASIARTIALLRFARRPGLAVAGGLLRTQMPWELIEKGAHFDGQVQPMHAGLDVRRVHDLLLAEAPDACPHYGAWWYFAFPIRQVRRFPFPFFVRGDDIHFGLINDFHITTLNGVASFGDDFSLKAGPMTAYLDARYHLVHALLARRGAAARIWWLGSRLFLKPLKGYLYDSARGVTLALEHVAQGPEFFRTNLDMLDVRAEIAGWGAAERMVPIDWSLPSVPAPDVRKEPRLRRLIRAVTMQGFLLPGWLLRARTLSQPKSFHGSASQVFRYRQVRYEHRPAGTGFIAVFDRLRFFTEVARFLRAWTRLALRLPALQRAYAVGATEMTTAEFWRDVYGPALAAPPGAAVSRERLPESDPVS